MTTDPNYEIDPKTTEMTHRYLLGNLELEEFVSLERELLSSPEAREVYPQAVRIDVALHNEALDDEVEVVPIPRTAALRWGPVAIAAAIAISVLVLWRLNFLGNEAPQLTVVSPVVEIATLGDSRVCVWKD